MIFPCQLLFPEELVSKTPSSIHIIINSISQVHDSMGSFYCTHVYPMVIETHNICTILLNHRTTHKQYFSVSFLLGTKVIH